MSKKLNIDELPLELQKQLKKENGINQRVATLTKDNIRTHAISVLNAIKHLTPKQRARVLIQANKINNI